MMRSSMPKSARGFTMVETTLAMTFIGILLLTVAYIIIQMSSIYQKTLSIKSVNTGGRELVEDFSRHISASSMVSTNILCGSGLTEEAAKACNEDGAFKYIYQQYYSDGSNNYTRDPSSSSVPIFGTFCTGLYSYIWNAGNVLNGKDRLLQNSRITVKYTDGDGNAVETNNFRLLRVNDVWSDACSTNFNGDTYSLNSNTTALTIELENQPEELLGDSDTELAIYDLEIFRPSRHSLTRHAYYAGSFILASLQGDVDILASDNFCKAPEGYISEFSYCAINKFNFAAQAVGEMDV